MAELSIKEMDQQSVAVLPERAALGKLGGGVKVSYIEVWSSAYAEQKNTLLSVNGASSSVVVINHQ